MVHLTLPSTSVSQAPSIRPLQTDVPPHPPTISFNLDLSQAYFQYPRDVNPPVGYYWTPLWVMTDQHQQGLSGPLDLERAIEVGRVQRPGDDANKKRRMEYTGEIESSAIALIDRMDGERARLQAELNSVKTLNAQLTTELALLKSKQSTTSHPDILHLTKIPINDSGFPAAVDRAFHQLILQVPEGVRQLPPLSPPSPQTLPMPILLKDILAALSSISPNYLPTSLRPILTMPKTSPPTPETCLAFLKLVKAVNEATPSAHDDSTPISNTSQITRTNVIFAADFLMSYDKSAHRSIPRPIQDDLMKAITLPWLELLVDPSPNARSITGLIRVGRICLAWLVSPATKMAILYSAGPQEQDGWVKLGSCKAIIGPFVNAALGKSGRENEIEQWKYNECYASNLADNDIENIFCTRLIHRLAIHPVVDPIAITVKDLQMTMDGHPELSISSECNKDLVYRQFTWMCEVVKAIAAAIGRIRG